MTDTDRRMRRAVLRAGGAALAAGLAGCLGGDKDPEPANASANETGDGTQNETGQNETGEEEQAATVPETAIDERPFRYVLSSRVLEEQGLADTPPPEVGSMANYVNLADMRDGLSDDAWENQAPAVYPQIMLAIKYDDLHELEIGDVPFEELFHDVTDVVYGSATDVLARTTLGYDAMMEHMEEHGYGEQRERNGWTVFDTTYDAGSNAGAMRVALNDDLVAYVTEQGTDLLWDLNPPRNNSLDQFMDLYIDMLAGDGSLSLSGANRYAREAEQAFNEARQRDWDTLMFDMSADSEIADARESGDQPVVAEAGLFDHEDEYQVQRTYEMFENGETNLTRPQEVPVYVGENASRDT